MRNALKILFAFSVALIIAFALVEIGVRVFVPQERPIFIADPLIRTIHKANIDTIREKGTEVKAHIQTNAQGFVGEDFVHEKPAGTYRIAAIGDSFTEAFDVDVDKSFSALIATQLTDAHQTPYQVYNFGISGSGSTLEYLTYTKYAQSYSPDLVLWQIYLGNDLADDLLLRADSLSTSTATTTTTTETHTGYLRSFLSNTFQSPRFFIREFEKISAVHEMLARYGIVSRMLSHYDEERTYPFVYDVYNSGETTVFTKNFSHMCDSVKEFNKETTAHGTRLVVLIIPAREEVIDEEWNAILEQYPTMKDKTWDRLLPQKQLKKCLEQEGVSYVDMYPVFKQQIASGAPRMYYYTDQHINGVGHETVSKSVVDYLKTH